jgi:HAMP domain-containing protein
MKLVVFIGLSLTLGAAAIAATLQLALRHDSELVAWHSVEQAAASFHTLTDGDTRMLSIALEAMEQNQQLAKDFAAKNREGLLAQLKGPAASFKAQHDITNWSYTSTDGTTFLRMSDTAYFGEKVDRPTVVKCLEQQAGQQGFAVGSQGFALRVSRPVFEGGRFVGCAEMGTEINRFVTRMKEQTGSEYALFLDKAGIDPEKWKRGRALLHLSDNWGDQPTIVAAANTSSDDALMRLDVPLRSLDARGAILDTTERGGKTFSRGVFPIADASGKRVAAIFVLNDITPLADSMKRTQWITMGVIGLLIVLISLALVLMIRTLVFRRLETIISIATRVVGGDFETAIPLTASDEIGTFELLFEQFRIVFLSVLHEAQAAAATQTPPADESKSAQLHN